MRSQLRGLKPGEAVGLDNIPARLLIDSSDNVGKPLTAIINSSLQSGVVPSEWKAARVNASSPCSKKAKQIMWTTVVLFLFCRLFLKC